MKRSILARIERLESKLKPASTFPGCVWLEEDETFEQHRAKLEAEGYIYDPAYPPLIFCVRGGAEDSLPEDRD